MERYIIIARVIPKAQRRGVMLKFISKAIYNILRYLRKMYFAALRNEQIALIIYVAYFLLHILCTFVLEYICYLYVIDYRVWLCFLLIPGFIVMLLPFVLNALFNIEDGWLRKYEF